MRDTLHTRSCVIIIAMSYGFKIISSIVFVISWYYHNAHTLNQDFSKENEDINFETEMSDKLLMM